VVLAEMERAQRCGRIAGLVQPTLVLDWIDNHYSVQEGRQGHLSGPA
jgi:hypothetical protein